MYLNLSLRRFNRLYTISVSGLMRRWMRRRNVVTSLQRFEDVVRLTSILPETVVLTFSIKVFITALLSFWRSSLRFSLYNHQVWPVWFKQLCQNINTRITTPRKDSMKIPSVTPSKLSYKFPHLPLLCCYSTNTGLKDSTTLFGQ